MPVYGVAITIPQPWGRQLQDARGDAGDPLAESIPPHVTLLPPTEIDAAGLEPFEDHLRSVAAAHPSFAMVLAGTGTFRPTSPVVFVQVSQGISMCERLERAVRGGPVERGLEFNYHPHVTVAHRVSEERLDRAFAGLARFRCEFDVSSIDLYAHCDDDVWRPMRSYALAASGA